MSLRLRCRCGLPFERGTPDTPKSFGNSMAMVVPSNSETRIGCNMLLEGFGFLKFPTIPRPGGNSSGSR